jgi:hypothetical protein
MTGEEFAKICFAARPLLWALAIVVILWVAAGIIPKIFGGNLGDDGTQNSPGPA